MADMDWRRMIVVAVAATACGFNSGGDGADSTGTSSTGTTDPTTNPTTTNPTTTNPTTTNPTTTDSATTDPATTDPATSDPSTDPTTTDSSTDPATTDPTTTGEDTTETDPTTGSSTGSDPGAYGPCDGNACPEGFACAVVVNKNNTAIANTCRPECDDVGDCPAPPSGSPQLICPAPNYSWCVLGCEIGMCPNGMECYDTPFGDHCHWPL